MLLNKIRHSLVFKLIMIMAFICFVEISVWAYFSINYQRNKAVGDTLGVADRISKTIRLGTHYSMMLNARDDIHQIILNTATQREIENVRIYNKRGLSSFPTSHPRLIQSPFPNQRHASSATVGTRPLSN